jgi:hypothetical protein
MRLLSGRPDHDGSRVAGKKIRSPRIRTSTPLWPGICAVAALIFVFARASAARLKSPARSQLGLDIGAERQNQPNIIYG